MKKLLLFFIVIMLFFSATAQVGNVGINTTNPLAMLHVKDSSVLFTGAVSLPVTPGNPPVSGAGTRMMWYPDKAAFRVGRVTGVDWNRDSIGNYSFAAGQDVKAKGNFSAAFGNTTYAIGVSSFATGFGTNAIGDFSTAMGWGTEASGIRSLAIGSLAIASGDSSTAIGKNTTASGLNSTAFGTRNTASGSYSTAMGLLTTASGIYSTAMGSNTIAMGNRSTAMGNGTTASGFISTAMGNGTTASGNYSTSMGNNTIASDDYSTAMGNVTTASKEYSTAMGNSTTASGSVSTAMGNGTTASGSVSTAMGNSTTASGSVSTAMGSFTTARAYGSLSIGQYNDSVITSSQTSWVTTDPLFIIGNGTQITRSNAITVLKNGNTGIGVTNPTNKLEVAGKTVTSNFQMTNGGMLNGVLQSDAAGNASWVNSTALSITEIDPQVQSTTTNFIPRWNGTALVDGVIQDNATNVGIGTAPVASNKLTVSGKTATTNFQMTNGPSSSSVMQGDAAGNASWSTSLFLFGGVTATSYNYVLTAYRALSIPASAFQLMPVNGTSTAGIASTTISGGQTLVTGTAGVIARFEAPVYLPENATIYEISLNVRDASGTYEVSADLLEQNVFTSSIIASVPGTGNVATPNDTNISVTGLNIAVNDSRAYFLRFNCIELNGNLRIYNAQIKYSVTGPR